MMKKNRGKPGAKSSTATSRKAKRVFLPSMSRRDAETLADDLHGERQYSNIRVSENPFGIHYVYFADRHGHPFYVDLVNGHPYYFTEISELRYQRNSSEAQPPMDLQPLTDWMAEDLADQVKADLTAAGEDRKFTVRIGKMRDRYLVKAEEDDGAEVVFSVDYSKGREVRSMQQNRRSL